MDRKNAIILTVIATATLLVAMVGATFAYFTAQKGGGASANATVTTSTSDSLEYGSFNPLLINATQENFGQGMDNLSSSTTGAVTLKANADTNATYCYTATLSVTSNDLVYTTDDQTPELTFSISKNGTAIITDQDITTIAAAPNAIQVPTAVGGTTYVHSITAAKATTVSDNWTASITLVNLPSDQQQNTNKSFVGILKFESVDCA